MNFMQAMMTIESWQRYYRMLKAIDEIYRAKSIV